MIFLVAQLGDETLQDMTANSFDPVRGSGTFAIPIFSPRPIAPRKVAAPNAGAKLVK